MPQLSKPSGRVPAFDGNPLEVGDDFFAPGSHGQGGGDRDLALRGKAAQRDRGERPAWLLLRVLGPDGGSYSVTPKVRGTYRLVCLVHPTTMAETLEVK